MGARVEANWEWDPAFRRRDQGRAALMKTAATVLARATNLAPRDTGELRRSGRVMQQGGRAIVAFDRPYAVIVHEALGTRFREGQPKFLEQAAQEVQDSLEGTLARAIRFQ